MAGLRDILAHAYFSLQNDMIWDIVQVFFLISITAVFISVDHSRDVPRKAPTKF